MRLLVIGSGGREHALAWKLAREKNEVFVAPGNPGMALEPNVTCLTNSAADFAGLAKLCREKKIEFVVVGPDQALADGAVDFFEKESIATFGPTRAATQIESSKSFAKDLMRAARIPTAKFESFQDFGRARNFIEKVEWGSGWVVKADGLALGKGVVVCENRAEALATVEAFLGQRTLGAAGERVVVEERLLGREVSAFFFCDGKDCRPLGMACDYKRIGEGDQGPNTGGMGAYSPADWLPEGFLAQVVEEIVRPLLKEMHGRGISFRGMLFVGLMVRNGAPKVIEFNARFGDPETQALLPLLDENLLPWLQASRDGSLGALPETGPRMKPLAAVHVVLAAAGYPGAVKKGDAISLPEEFLPQENETTRRAKVFFAGVARTSAMALATNGGRVLGLTALAESRAEARRRAHELVAAISFSGLQKRGDVGA